MTTRMMALALAAGFALPLAVPGAAGAQVMPVPPAGPGCNDPASA